jgi:signal transduction histidine kinase/ligand-binding sensor domain-containing protein
MLLVPLFAALQIEAPATDSTPVRPITQLIHTTWTPKLGGSPIGIRTLAQTTDGYIWIGSFFGLWRFDGVRFVHYTPLGGDSIPDGAIVRLLATRDGSLWMIGGRGGVVSRLRGGRVSTFAEAQGLAPVTGLAESSDGMLVAGTIEGLFRFSQGKWDTVNAAWGFPGKRARSVYFDRDNTLWVLTEDRVVYLPKGASEFLDPGISIKPANNEFQFGEEKDGTVWLATVGESLYTLHKSGSVPGRRTEVVIDPLEILIDRKGSLWVATGSDGLRRVPDVARVRGRRIARIGPESEHFSMKDGLLTDIPTALLEDHEGNIWVGSANGLERFREGTFTPILASGPARPRFVMAGRDSSVWTAPYGLGTMQRFGPQGQDEFHTGLYTRTVAHDASGRAIVVGNNRILRLEGNRFVPVRLRPGTARGLYNVAIDPAGNVWVHSEDLGLLRLEGDSLVPVANTVESVNHDGQPFSDRKGTIWVAQYNRVYRYSGQTLTTYSKDQGIWGFVYGFFEDTSGTLWAATGDGLSRFEGDSFRTLKRKGQIPGYTVVGMAQDDEGAWWLATLPGILRFPPGEIEHAFTDSTYVPNYRAFDESDGMVGALVKGYWGPVLAKSRDGRIWVATDSGLASVDPRRVPVATPPPVSLEVVRIEGREQAIADGAELPPGTRDMEIDYTSLTFGTPERIRFRYRLEGADSAWHEVGDRRRAYFTGLAPASYRFRVSASYGDGIWNETGASWSFRVLPEWNQTAWFKAMVVLAIAGLAGTIVALTQRGRHARAQLVLRHEYEATLAERTRIAQDLHDTLLQGFAGVTMQLSTVELDLPERPQAATETVQRVLRLAHTALREARERVWDLRETELGSDDLPTALEAMARERSAGTTIEVSVATIGPPHRLTRSLEDAAFRIGREAVVNAVKHAGARRIEIRCEFSSTRLLLEVRDDGCGFTKVQSEAAKRKGHLGLNGMRDRAAHAGGHCEIRPRPGGGTIVALELPLTPVRV